MKKIFKFALIVLGLRYVVSLMDENVDIKIQIKKLRNELANLETEDLENKLKDFFNKYDPKYICIEIYSDKISSFNIKKNKIYKYLIKKNYKLLLNKRENYIFKKKL